jgi:spermidine/putrescine transport system substrate-binding protein
MKKSMTALMALLVSGSALAAEKVVVYNWSEYIDDSLLAQFTKETGIEVEYSTFDSNEVMYSKLKLQKGKGYDLVVPSTYYVSKMARDGLLQPIDKSKISHFADLDPALLNKPYDPNNQFSVPYLWGSTAISYNAEEIEPGSITAWKDLWDPKWKGNLLFTDDVREVFHMAFRINGHSANTQDPEEIKQAYELLKQVMPNVLVFNSDAPREPYLSGDVIIGMNWNGEVMMANEEEKILEYVYPVEGANFWVDSFVIPSGAANVENAHKLIDFLTRPENSKANTEFVGYATPSLKAKALLSPELANSPVVFPPESAILVGEFHQDVGDETIALMNEYWQKLKAGQ